MTWSLQRLGRRQTSWNLRYSSRSSAISFSIKENQTYLSCIFPRGLLSSGGELCYVLKMISMNTDFQKGEKFEMTWGKSCRLYTLQRYICCMCVWGVFGAKCKSPKRNLRQRLKSVRDVCWRYLLEAFRFEKEVRIKRATLTIVSAWIKFRHG